MSIIYVFYLACNKPKATKNVDKMIIVIILSFFTICLCATCVWVEHERRYRWIPTLHQEKTSFGSFVLNAISFSVLLFRLRNFCYHLYCTKHHLRSYLCCVCVLLQPQNLHLNIPLIPDHHHHRWATHKMYLISNCKCQWLLLIGLQIIWFLVKISVARYRFQPNYYFNT